MRQYSALSSAATRRGRDRFEGFVVLHDQVDLILPVARGNTDLFSTHTGTLGLIEAILVGVAAKRPAQTAASLKRLNDLRSEVAGEMMNLPVSDRRRSGARKRKRA